MNILSGVAERVLSDLISALILGLAGGALYLLLYFTERQRLLHFFGVRSSMPRLRIYVSRLQIKPKGTEGFEPLTNGYSGPSITKLEYDGALLVRDLVRSSILGTLPERLSGWLGHHHVGFQTLDATVDVCPRELGNVDFGSNLVVLGTGIYNLVAKHYLDHERCQFAFTKNEQGERVIRVRQGGLRDVAIPGRSSGREIAVLQRINDEQHGSSSFLCAGLGSSATYGCARYLVQHWHELLRRYGDREFAVFLAFPGQQPDAEAVVDPLVIFETGPQRAGEPALVAPAG